MSRRDVRGVGRLLVVALASLSAACVTVPARVARPAPASCEPERSVTWSVANAAPRRVAVSLTVLPEASISWRVDGRQRLADALQSWNRAGLPVRMVSAEPRDSVGIKVIVVRRLPIDPDDPANAFRAGVTHLTVQSSGGIARVQVLIAEETPGGRPYSAGDQAATLLHELGHALGVPHSEHPQAIMSPRAVAASLTPYDVSLARSVYGADGCGAGSVITASRPF